MGCRERCTEGIENISDRSGSPTRSENVERRRRDQGDEMNDKNRQMPCLLCELDLVDNLDDIDAHKGNLYPSGAGMREHLVHVHAPFVARALLSPDVNDKVHFWLMANIEYNAALTTNDEETGEDGEEEISYRNGECVELNEEGPMLNGGESFDFGYSQPQSHNGEENRRSRRKRTMPLRRNSGEDDSEQPPLKQSTVEEVEEDDEDGVVDRDSLLLLQDDVDDSLMINTVEEKTVRRVPCQICGVDVCSTARQRHVYLVHLKRLNLFVCSICDYRNSNSIWETRKHCIAQHSNDAHAISNEDEHRAEIQMWNQRCFPGWKSRKSTSSTCWNLEQVLGMASPGQSSVDDGEESSSMDEDAAMLQRLFPDDEVGLDEHNANGSFFGDEDATLVACLRQPPDGLIVDDRTCHLCWEESRYPGRHIAQKHLKKPLYECPICEGFGSYESCTVNKHMAKVHPDNMDQQPVSNLDKYADEIRDLQARCFPNRPMKLVRPHAGSRPRERHHCQLCGAQVAQSDRQRHVYHRHLQRTRIFECPLCSFASNYDVHRVKWHIKWMHKDETGIEPVSHENEYRDEIDRLNEQCFPGWQHRRRPFWWLDSDEAQQRVEQAKLKKATAMAAMQQMKDEPGSPTASLASHSETGGDIPSASGSQTEWTCQLCKKEFKPSANFLRHVAKDHLQMPLYQCPICEGHGGHDAYEIRSHMVKVHGSAPELEPISNIENHCDEIQAVYSQCFPGRRMRILDRKMSMDIKTYDEPRVQCRECSQEMKTEDRQIHVYRHHLKEPRLYECPVCDFSHHACSSDVKAHIKYVHREHSNLSPKANLIQFSREIAEWNDRCFPGWINRRLPAAALEDFNRCRLCEVEVRQTSRHIAEVHLHMSLHQCPLCEYGAAESRLVRRHMKNNHKKKEIKGLEPIANVVEHRSSFSELHDRCFPGRPKRLSNITISDEGRRAKCRQCGSTISRKRRLSHLLERHLKKPIYRCPFCAFNSHFDESTVQAHMKDQHEEEMDVETEVFIDLEPYKEELENMAPLCFSDWNLML